MEIHKPKPAIKSADLDESTAFLLNSGGIPTTQIVLNTIDSQTRENPARRVYPGKEYSAQIPLEADGYADDM